MPSIFTRARTSSTKTLKANLPDASHSSNHNQNQNPNANVPPLPYSIDEFGRVSSRNAGGVQPLPPLTPPKDKDRRAHTVSDRRVLSTTTVNLANPDPSRPADLLEDGFLQTNIAPPLAPDGSQDPLEQYGYLGHAVHVVLGLDDVQRLVDVISDELIQRGEPSISDPPHPPHTDLYGFSFFIQGSLRRFYSPILLSTFHPTQYDALLMLSCAAMTSWKKHASPLRIP